MYVTAIATAIGHTFVDEVMKKEGEKTGGDMTQRSSKQAPSVGFVPSKYVPDGRVYAGLPAKNSARFLDTNDEQFYLDKLWLDAQFNPEYSYGEYVPDGMWACSSQRYTAKCYLHSSHSTRGSLMSIRAPRSAPSCSGFRMAASAHTSASCSTTNS